MPTIIVQEFGEVERVTLTWPLEAFAMHVKDCRAKGLGKAADEWMEALPPETRNRVETHIASDKEPTVATIVSGSQ